MNISQWVLDHYGQEVYQPGLERIQEAIKELKPSLQKTKIVIIAGTNGKGETTHRLRQHFMSESFCSWTSPHVESITERFSSEWGNIQEEELKDLVLHAHELVLKNKYRITFYEFLFFVFCLWAVKKNPKYLFLEVGLGGRLDAVNALDADQVILTSISRDHQEFLGNRFDLILQEKLGVLRPEATLITFLDSKYLLERTARYVKAVGASWVDLNQFFVQKMHFSRVNQYLAYASSCLLQNVSIDKKFIPQGESVPHRGEIIHGQNTYQFFGSHNLDGVRKLIQFLEAGNYTLEDAPIEYIVVSFSKRNPKDVTHMLKVLQRVPNAKVLVTSFEHAKAFDKNELMNLANQEGIEFVCDIKIFFESNNKKRILITGSYYFISSIIRLCRT